MNKVVLWGLGEGYEELINNVRYEILKENIDVIAIVTDERDIYCPKKDGFIVLPKKELQKLDYDYIVVTAAKYFEEIKKEAIKFGCEDKRIIFGDVMKLPYFDFGKYVRIIENPVTILSDDCWGGIIYKKIRLPGISPTINTLFSKDDFLRLIQDPMYYFEQELIKYADGDKSIGRPPMGIIGSGEKAVIVKFPHERLFEEAKINWDRRMLRVNKNNLLVKFGISLRDLENGLQRSDIEQYSNEVAKLPYKKIFFAPFSDMKNVFCSPRFLLGRPSGGKMGAFECDYNKYCRENCTYDIDLLNLLLYGEDYSRYK